MAKIQQHEREPTAIMEVLSVVDVSDAVKPPGFYTKRVANKVAVVIFSIDFELLASLNSPFFADFHGIFIFSS
jgi:hypothetical protein